MTKNPERNCECCALHPVVAVVSSGVGAISFGFCKECLVRGAEPIFMFRYLKDAVANNNKDALHKEVFSMVTFYEGEYKTFEQMWDFL